MWDKYLRDQDSSVSTMTYRLDSSRRQEECSYSLAQYFQQSSLDFACSDCGLPIAWNVMGEHAAARTIPELVMRVAYFANGAIDVDHMHN